jgi:hypothetical protein
MISLFIRTDYLDIFNFFIHFPSLISPMNSSLPHSVRQKKTDQEGNANPRSKKLAPQSNKKFIEDNSKKALSFQNTPNQIGRINQNLRKKT